MEVAVVKNAEEWIRGLRLPARGGLSNWVFVFGEQLTMFDMGMKPAVIAGMQAGVFANMGLLEWKRVILFDILYN